MSPTKGISYREAIWVDTLSFSLVLYDLILVFIIKTIYSIIVYLIYNIWGNGWGQAHRKAEGNVEGFQRGYQHYFPERDHLQDKLCSHIWPRYIVYGTLWYI